MNRRILPFYVISALVGALIIISLHDAKMVHLLHLEKSQYKIKSNVMNSDETSRYGKPVSGMNHVIVYNSVPKCGSRTLGSTTHRIFRTYGRDVKRYSLRPTLNTSADPSKKDVTRIIRHAKPPSYLQGHGDFVFVDRKPHPPVYINFVRDPVSRMVSAYYFTRYGDSTLKMGRNDRSQNRTIEECILTRHMECTSPGKYPRIFCGFNERCRTDPEWALEQAKANVDKYYTFIGITEEYDASLQVLERLLPDMLGGLVEAYRKPPAEKNVTESSKTKNKRPLAEELADIVRQSYKVDYEFYNYVYDKFRQLKRRYGID